MTPSLWSLYLLSLDGQPLSLARSLSVRHSGRCYQLPCKQALSMARAFVNLNTGKQIINLCTVSIVIGGHIANHCHAIGVHAINGKSIRNGHWPLASTPSPLWRPDIVHWPPGARINLLTLAMAANSRRHRRRLTGWCNLTSRSQLLKCHTVQFVQFVG